MSRINEYTSLIVVKELKKKKPRFHVKIYYSKDGFSKRVTTNVYVNDKKAFERDRILRKSNAFDPDSWSSDRDKLDNLQLHYETLISNFVKEYHQKPSVKQLEDLIKDAKKQTQKVFNYITDYLKDYKEYSSRKGRNSSCVIKSVYSAFEYFTIKRNANFTFKDLNEDFFIDYIKFLLFEVPKQRSKDVGKKKPNHNLSEPVKFDTDFGLNNNTVLKRLEVFLTFLKWVIKKRQVDINYEVVRDNLNSAITLLEVKEYDNKKFAFREREQVEKLASIAFENSLTSDFYYDNVKHQSGKNFVSKEQLIRAKDYFIISILTGSRISDLKKIQPNHIKRKSQKSQKTGSDFYLNSNDDVKSLLERHQYKFGFNDQKYNKCLKLVMKQFYCDFLNNPDEMLIQIERRGKKEQVTYEYIYNLVCSHSGRRSFATITYHQGKLRPQVIMKFTGHKSEREFNKYIQFTPEKDIEEVSNFMSLNIL